MFYVCIIIIKTTTKEVYYQAIVVTFAPICLGGEFNNILSFTVVSVYIFLSITSSYIVFFSFTGFRSKESKVLLRSEKHSEGCPCCDPFLSKVRKKFCQDSIIICVWTTSAVRIYSTVRE